MKAKLKTLAQAKFSKSLVLCTPLLNTMIEVGTLVRAKLPKNNQTRQRLFQVKPKPNELCGWDSTITVLTDCGKNILDFKESNRVN
jgi:hypothetical protein